MVGVSVYKWYFYINLYYEDFYLCYIKLFYLVYIHESSKLVNQKKFCLLIGNKNLIYL